MSMRRFALVAIAAAILGGGCAIFPKQQEVANFGNAAAEVTAASNEAYAIHKRMARDVSDAEAALAYVNRESVDFPPPLTVDVVSPGRWQKRINLALSLQQYAGELAKIGTPGAAESAGSAAAGLFSSLTEFAKAANAAVPAGISGGMPKIAAAVVTLGFNSLMAQKMRAVMRKNDPMVQEAARLLTADFRKLASLSEADASLLSGVREQTLRSMQRDRQTSRAELLDKFHQAVAADREASGLVNRYAAIAESVGAMAKAHEAVAFSRDSDRAMNDFLTATKTLAVGLAAFSAN